MRPAVRPSVRWGFAIRVALLLAVVCTLAPLSAAEEPDPGPLFVAPTCNLALDANQSQPVPVEPPDAFYRGPCFVSRNCDNGTQISCNGSSTCSSGPGQGGGYVNCDGNVTWCPYDPNCNAGYLCNQPSECFCYGAVCGCINRHCLCLE